MPIGGNRKGVRMTPERICEVLAQYTQQINFYSLLKLPFLGCEPNRAVLSVLL